MNVGRAEGVPGKNDQWVLPVCRTLRLIESVVEEVDCHLSTEVGAPDSNDNQDVGVRLDLLGGLLDPLKFILVVLAWQVEPVAVGGPGTGPVAEFIIRGLDHCLHFTKFVVMNKLFQALCIK